MNLSEALYCRKSRRSYLNILLEESIINSLRTLVEKYNVEAGLSMELVEDGSNAFNGLRKSYGMFNNVRTILLLKGTKDDADLREKCGYFGELIVLEATRLGLGTCWVGATFDHSSPVFHQTENELLVCVITLGHVSEQATLKENIIRKMSHGKTRPLEYFYRAETTPPAWFLEGIHAVQLAPSAVNRQKYYLEYKNEDIRMISEDTGQFGMVDLGIAKAHFVTAAGGAFKWGNPGIYMK